MSGKSDEDIEFYSASVNAWYNSALEHDKSLLTLSAAGIGLLITLLNTIALDSHLILALYALSILCFIICLIAVLRIFNVNRTHIVKLFKGDEDLENKELEVLDRVAFWSFILGVIFSASIGVTSSIQQFSKKDSKMTDNKSNSVKGIANDSFNGVHTLQKSFNGAQQLKPAAATNSSTQTSPTSPTQQPAATPAKKD